MVSLIERKIELYCAVGTDCEKWEEALDWLCIRDDGEENVFIVTTSHPNETFEEVKIFANQWESKNNNDVEIVKI